MEFLVCTRLTRLESAADDEVATLLGAEGARAEELMAAGTMRRLWPWMKVEVHPLAKHPFDRG